MCSSDLIGVRCFHDWLQLDASWTGGDRRWLSVPDEGGEFLSAWVSPLGWLVVSRGASSILLTKRAVSAMKRCKRASDSMGMRLGISGGRGIYFPQGNLFMLLPVDGEEGRLNVLNPFLEKSFWTSVSLSVATGCAAQRIARIAATTMTERKGGPDWFLTRARKSTPHPDDPC